jgi:hypothetical protein
MPILIKHKQDFQYDSLWDFLNDLLRKKIHFNFFSNKQLNYSKAKLYERFLLDNLDLKSCSKKFIFL